MTTTYHLERDDPAFMLGDAPVHQPDVAHRTLRACARRLGRIRRACRLVHGPGTWLPLRVYALEGGVARRLTLDEADDLDHYAAGGR